MKVETSAPHGVSRTWLHDHRRGGDGLRDPAAPLEPWLRRSGEVAETLSWGTHVGSWVRLHLLPEIAPWYVRFLREARTPLLEQAAADQVRG